MHFLDDMALFVEVVKARSFTKAADNLDIPKSTLSVRIHKLEDAIGLKLLNRTTRKVEVTEVGQLYYEKAINIIEEAHLAHIQLTEMIANPQGVLKVLVPVDFAIHIIAPILAEFSERYPHIQLEFDLMPRKVEQVGEHFDIALCHERPQDSTLVAHHLSAFSGGIYASARYLQQYGEPKNLNDLTKHECIRFHTEFNHEWHLMKGKEQQRISVLGQYHSNSMEMSLTLAAQGLGLAILPEIMAQHAVEKGQIKRILPQWHTAEMNIYAITATRILPRKTQVFLELLQEKLKAG
ncbi:DNA-binding transcriptional LysR family regulator [Pasteurella langaaensis DSM 22999]|uniref:DNA-binding transcriptional LysR family regulator n=1 Tax=Alitibacter langaaensis DSM 22999 TaxID=1122935 RepID=A0A2U0T8A0_9PAST|nr:LysR family transcriptional regulator [Pasteurella langaaensis]PVX39850.1 DNA-binding transcriptional LysR family regulator [Pasteurella langaaensis DSM 22999]